MVDFNLEFEVRDLPLENLSSAIVEKNFEDLIEKNGEGNLTTDDVANSTTDDVGNLAVLCGLTITNQSLKIVQVNSALLSSLRNTPNILPCVNVLFSNPICCL